MIKEAAKRLFDKKEITQEECNNLFKLAEDVEKNGALTPNFEAIRNAVLGLSLGTGAALAGSELYKKIKMHSDISNAYDTMQEKVPALAEYPQDKIQDYFEVVKTFSPLSASNPYVAGALVHKMLEFGGVDHKLVQDISKIEHSAPSGFLYDMAKSVGGLTKLPKEGKDE